MVELIEIESQETEGGPDMEDILKVENIDLFYGSIHALHDITFNVRKGEIVSLIGANGAGKTSTLRAISGLEKIKKGKIIYQGKEIQHVPAHSIVSMGISHVPEGRHVFGDMTVFDNLKMGAFLRNDRAGVKESLEQVMQIFPRLGERKNQVSSTLSGGEQQMLAIARAMMSKPDLMILDEPSMGLAPQIIDQILQIIVDINKEGTTVLLVEQNANAALAISDYAYVLETGRIVMEGDALELMANDDVKKAYLGG